MEEFLSPAVTLAGDGAARSVGAALAARLASGSAVLVVADRVVADRGLADGLLSGIRSAGLTVELFAGIEGEPTLDVAEDALRRSAVARAVAVVGIGGGSAMDVAKAVALAAGVGVTVATCIASSPSLDATVLPLALVPTTAGTGAEATRIAMFTHEGRKLIGSHPRMVPLIAVLDPELTFGLPASVTAATGMDAYAHAVESYLSTKSGPRTRAAALQAVVALREFLPRAFAEGDDHEARRAVLYAAHDAGLALNAGVVLGHSIAYTVANRAHLPHGVTSALALPYCVAYAAGAPVVGGEALAAAVTGGASTDLRAAALELYALVGRLGLPNSSQAAGIPSGAEAEMAQECVERYPRPTNPRPLDVALLEPLYAAMWSGDIAAVTHEASAVGTGS